MYDDFNHAMDIYLAEKDMTKGSCDLYSIILKQYKAYLALHNIEKPTTDDVKDYIHNKISQGYSSKWIYLQVNVIKGFYQYLATHYKRLGVPEFYATDISEPIKNVPLNQPKSKPILTVEQAKQLIINTKENRHTIWQYRDHAMVYLMLTTGLRSIEIRRAKKSDLKVLQGKRILYVHGKGRSFADAFVKLSKGVSEAIDQYLIKRKDINPYLFIAHRHPSKYACLSRPFFNRWILRVLKESGLDEVEITTHALRHSAATFNLLRGSSLESTRRFLRHVEPSSTLIYAHHLENQKSDTGDQIEDYIFLAEENEKKEP